jgi:hypothetical protein
MIRKCLCFAVCFVFVVFASSCKNNNIFSWAHVPGDGSYESLMSDADSAMNSNDYAKAAEYYKLAVKARPGDQQAVMGYAAAVILNGLGLNLAGVINRIVDDDTSNLLAQISPEQMANLDGALRGLVDDRDMLPALFGGGNYPQDSAVNLNGGVIYALAGVVAAVNNPAVKPFIVVDGNFKIDSTKLLVNLATDPEVAGAVRLMRNDVERAIVCLGDASGQGAIAQKLRDEFGDLRGQLNAWLAK